MSLNQAKVINLEKTAASEDAPAFVRQLEQALRQESFNGQLFIMRSDRNLSVSINSDRDIYKGGVRYVGGKFVTNINVKAEGDEIIYDNLQRVLQQYGFAQPTQTQATQ